MINSQDKKSKISLLQNVSGYLNPGEMSALVRRAACSGARFAGSVSMPVRRSESTSCNPASANLKLIASSRRLVQPLSRCARFCSFILQCISGSLRKLRESMLCVGLTSSARLPVLQMGPSGSGKTTLLGALHYHGFRLCNTNGCITV